MSDYSDDEDLLVNESAKEAEDEEKYVKIVSKDGLEFIVEKDILMYSSYLKALLNSDFRESTSGVIRLDDLEGEIVERVIQYFCHKKRYANANSNAVPEFDVSPKEALALLSAANYLDC